MPTMTQKPLMTNKTLSGLYAVTPDYTNGEKLIAAVSSVLNGGCKLVQYRDKTSPPTERVARARALLKLCQNADAKLLINDDLPLAILIKADGAHLGKDDGNLAAARAILGPGKILGTSCYADYAAAHEAQRYGADYVAFGAIFSSPTKPNAPNATVDLFKRAKTELSAASCAIGGLTLANAPGVISAGADLLAVITDLFSAPDITARALAYQRLFEERSA